MKRIVSILLSLMILLLLSVTAVAVDDVYLYDYAELLTAGEEAEINRKLVAIAEKRGASLYIITKYGQADVDTKDYAQTFCDSNDIDSKDDGGLVSVLDLDDNSHLFFTYGDGDIYFPDDKTDEMFDAMMSYYNNKDYYSMYVSFADSVDLCLENFFIGANITTAETSAVLETTTALKSDSVTEPGTESVYGEDYDFSAPDSGGKFVIDSAELLTDEQEAEMVRKIEAIRSEFKFEVVIHTTNSSGGKKNVDYADDYYDYNGYGLDSENSGVLMLINMDPDNREYYLSTCGYGITAFTDYGIDYILDEMEYDMGEGDYDAALNKFLNLVPDFVREAREVMPYDTNHTIKGIYDYVGTELMALVICLVIALVVVKLFSKGMNTAVAKSSAGDYIVPGSLNITNKYERFINTTTSKSRRRIESSSGGGGGGGSSTHTSSSGTSHGGGGRSF